MKYSAWRFALCGLGRHISPACLVGWGVGEGVGGQGNYSPALAPTGRTWVLTGPRRGFPLSSGVVCRGPGSLGKSPEELSGAGFTVTVTETGLSPVLPTFPGNPVVGWGHVTVLASGLWSEDTCRLGSRTPRARALHLLSLPVQP